MNQEQVVDEVIEPEDFDSDFDSGFSGEVSTAKPTPTPEPVADPVQAPRYAQLTEAQVQDLLSKATAIDEIRADTKKKLDSAFGTIGNLKQVIDRLQTETQSGKPVELTAADVAEISADYPELGESTLKVLQRLAGKLKGTGAAPFDESRIDQRVLQHLNPAMGNLEDTIRNKIAAEELEETYPNWREIAGAPNQDTEFRRWLKTQPDGYGDKVFNSNRAKIIGDAIAKFMTTKKPVAKPGGNRNDRLAEAIAAKSTGGHANDAPEDDFDAGFKKKFNR